MRRFEKFMEALCTFDRDNFSEHYADLKYFEGKTGHGTGVSCASRSLDEA